MYSPHPALVFGFHGTDEKIGRELINGASFKQSDNPYDWLGSGIYFWENNYARAKQYAEWLQKRERSSVKNPFVVGSVIDLGNCLDLLDHKYNEFLKVAHKLLMKELDDNGQQVPKNKSLGQNDFDFKGRFLDCKVIQYACQLAENEQQKFDSVRAAFIEGKPLYDGSKFYSENHIQIAVRNPECIKAVFLPRVSD